MTLSRESLSGGSFAAHGRPGTFGQVSSCPEDTAENEYWFSPETAVRTARRTLDELEGRVPDETLERLRLLISEVATNAVRHTGLESSGSEPNSDGYVGLRLIRSHGTVRVEVTDPGPGFERPERPSPDPEHGSGYGLYLVDKLADRWGTERAEPARVWLELDY